MEQIEIDKIDQNLGQQWNIGDSQLINQNNKNIKERKKEKKKVRVLFTNWLESQYQPKFNRID